MLFCKSQIIFFIIILLATSDLTCHLALPFATSASSVTELTVGTISKTILKKSGTDLGAKSIYGPNRKMTQNVGTKSAFMPKLFDILLTKMQCHLV